jgi:tetratricopeptide (TPR) repeat protein
VRSLPRARKRALADLARCAHRTPDDLTQIAALAARAMPLESELGRTATTADVEAAEAFLAALGPMLLPRRELSAFVMQAQATHGDFDAVLQTLGTSSTQLRADELQALVSAASTAGTRGKLGDAEHMLRAGLARAPSAAALLSALGLTLLAQGRADEAVPLLQRQRDLHDAEAGRGPRFQSGLQLAYALLASGEPEQARGVLDADCSDGSLSCAALRVRAALESDAVADALKLAHTALAQLGDDVGLLYLEAEAATRLGDVARARAAYERILARAPHEPRAKLGLESLRP